MYYIFLFYRKNILYVILAAELYLHCQKECYHVVHRQHCRYPYFNTGVHYTMKKRKITSVFLALGLFASLLFQVPISAEEADQSAAVEASGTISTNSISGWPQASDISSVSIISSTASIGIPAATRPRTLIVTPLFQECRRSTFPWKYSQDHDLSSGS